MKERRPRHGATPVAPGEMPLLQPPSLCGLSPASHERHGWRLEPAHPVAVTRRRVQAVGSITRKRDGRGCCRADPLVGDVRAKQRAPFRTARPRRHLVVDDVLESMRVPGRPDGKPWSARHRVAVGRCGIARTSGSAARALSSSTRSRCPRLHLGKADAHGGLSAYGGFAPTCHRRLRRSLRLCCGIRPRSPMRIPTGP